MKFRKFLQKWSLALKVIPFVIFAVLIKLLFHYAGFEIITLNALFTSILAATIFLIGFLISGVLSDYKESEKLPAELACSMEVLYDESSTIHKNKNSKESKEFIKYQLEFLQSVNKWLYKKESKKSIFDKLSKFNDYFLAFESQTQAAFVSRMKQEQNNIRKIITRISVISETNFVASAYAIAEALAFFLIIGMVLVKIDPFYEALFFVVLVTFLVLYMIFLIRDLDDPFEYSEHGEAGSEVSLHPLHEYEERLKEHIKALK